MHARRLRTIRKFLTLGALLVVLFAVTHLTRTTSTTVVTPMTVLYFDAGSDGPTTAWLIAGIVVALTASWPLVAGRFKRTGTTAQSDAAMAASSAERPQFPNYLQIRSTSRLSVQFWAWLRFGMVAASLVYIAVLILDPDDGLWLWWQITVPLLPALFLIAPGIWRNICPLAASNQLPRVLNFSRAINPPKWLTEYGFVIGAIGFFAMASSRKWLFNHNGPATGILIFFALAAALLGGYLYKGKSGWCSSLCPLYPVQRFYNRTPFATVANAHCNPCVGCTKNCYDFNPGSSYVADLHDDDPHYASYRKVFAAVMPGFIVAYFTVPDPHSVTAILTMYLEFALYMVLSIGVFTVLETFLKISASKLTAIYGAVALNLFYGFGLPNWLKAVGSMFAVTPPDWLSWALRGAVLVVTIVWVARTYRVERRYNEQQRQLQELQIALTPVTTTVATGVNPTAPVAAQRPEIAFLPGDLRVPVEAGRTLLDIAESNKQPIKSGCRMGVCGADPIMIVDGQENLPPMGADEKATLERLGLGGNCRLACMCRPTGSVSVALDPKANIAAPAKSTAPIEQPKPIESRSPRSPRSRLSLHSLSSPHGLSSPPLPLRAPIPTNRRRSLSCRPKCAYPTIPTVPCWRWPNAIRSPSKRAAAWASAALIRS